MSAKSKKVKPASQNIKPQPAKVLSANLPVFGIGAVLFTLLYFLVDFIPSSGTNDNMAVEWLYVSAVNIAVGGYLVINFEKYKAAIFSVANQLLSKAYLAFIALAGLSIFYAINGTEAWVCFIRVLSTAVCFFNLAVIFKNRSQYFIYLAAFVSILLFFQCWQTLSQFFKDIKSTTSLAQIIYNLKEHAGNKNILAASIVIKLPLLFYCIYTIKHWVRYLFAVMLCPIVLNVIIINARASYITLLLQLAIYLAFCIAIYLKQKNIRLSAINLSVVFVPVIAALLISQSIYNNIEKKAALENNGQSNISANISAESLTSGSSSQQRLKFYKHAAKYIKENPIIGAGIGNWKLADIPYDLDTENDFSFAKHVHDDYLQITAETGILGGLVFLSIFVIAIVNTVKVLKSDRSETDKIIAAVSFFMLGAYMVDAALNFPHERPVMQVYFALFLAVNLMAVESSPQIIATKPIDALFKIVPGLLLLTTLIATYYHNINFKASKIQFVSNKELFADPKKPVIFTNNDKFPKFPNLADNNYPFDVVKAFNSYQLGNNEDALKLLNASTDVNPYSMANEYVKSLVFNKINRLDSAIYYAEKGFYKRPRNLYLFRSLADICVKTKDSTRLQKAFQFSVPYNDDARMLDYYVFSNISMGGSVKKSYQAVDLAEKKWPNVEDIKYKRYYVNAIVSSNKQDNKTALENLLKLSVKYPDNYAYKQDIGAIFYVLKDYQNALKYLDDVLVHNGSVNGKAEFFKGNTLLVLGKKDEACSFLKSAADQNYPNAINIYTANGCTAAAAPKAIPQAPQTQLPNTLNKKFFP